MKTNEMRRFLFTGAALMGLTMLAPSMWAADAAAGKMVFDKRCKVCHGPDGQGNPGMAKALNIEFKPLGGADIQKMSDADLKKTITMGMGKMKPVSGLSDADVDNVIAQIRSMKK